MKRTRTSIGLGGVVLALVLAACSNGSGGSGGGGNAGGGQGSQGAAAMVKVTKGSLGQMLVDAQGHTLYVFETDTNGTSSCYGQCASMWPALTTDGSPTAGTGLMGGALGTAARTDGSTQVTIDGHPLYTFSGDSAAGDTKGEGIGGVWFVASPTGAPLKAGSGTSGSNGGNGSGSSPHYGY
jgi:predicted lipoprotein with Yx(FWY)xxD motif